MLLLWIPYIANSQYSIHMVAKDAVGGDTLYVKNNTDSLFRLVAGQYQFARTNKVTNYVPFWRIMSNLDNTADISKPVSTATQAALDLKANTSAISNINNTSDANKPISTATQTALNLKQTIPTASQGLGGTITQATNKTTGVTLNKQYGQITMNGAALAAAAEVAFTLTNSTIASTDVVLVNVQSVGTAGAYLVSVGAVANGSCSITVSNASAGSLSQAIVLNFVVIKSFNN